MYRYGLIFLMLTTVSICLIAAEEIQRQRRVYQGSPVNGNDYPFHISLWFSGEKGDEFDNAVSDHFCSGTFVDRQWVITSGYCISDKNTTKWSARLINDQLDKGTTIGIEKIVIHPKNHINGMYNNNIALLKLATPVENFKSEWVNQDSNCPTSKSNMYVIGYGRNGTDTIISNRLQKVEPLTLYDTSDCNAYFNRDMVLEEFEVSGLNPDETTVCAFLNKPGHNIAGSGDAGAPLVASCNGRDVVVGITVYCFDACKAPDICPTLFTRVSAFYEWIKEVVDKNQ